MGQTVDIHKLVGREITYRDSFSGNQSAFLITRIKYDENRHGYEIRGDNLGDFIFLSETRAKTLAIRSILTLRSKIYRRSYEETYTIQG